MWRGIASNRDFKAIWPNRAASGHARRESESTMRWLDIILPGPERDPALAAACADARRLAESIDAIQQRDGLDAPTVTARLAIEAGVPQGWHRYVGSAGEVIGLDRFGASAPYKTLMEKFGFTAENIASWALALLKH